MKKALLAIAAFLIFWEILWWVAGVGPVSPWRLASLLKSNDPPVLVDVRSSMEYDLFHIPGALHIPDLSIRPLALGNLDRSRTVVVLCMTGHRSSLAANSLKKTGFREVRNLTGGLAGWILTRHPVTYRSDTDSTTGTSTIAD